MKGIIVHLTGTQVSEVAEILLARLSEFGRKAFRVDSGAANLEAALAAQPEAVVLATHGDVKGDGNRLEIAIDSNDTPDFAAEKVLDALAAAGVLELESSDYTPEEEEEIRRRLANLGYIE